MVYRPRQAKASNGVSGDKIAGPADATVDLRANSKAQGTPPPWAFDSTQDARPSSGAAT